MKQIVITTILLITFIIQGSDSFAIDLMGSYQQALAHDPDFLIAQANKNVTAQAIAIAHAGLMPNLDLIGSATLSHNGQGDPIRNGSVALYSLNLTQPLFNFAKWINYQASKDTVRAAIAIYAAAWQDLMVRLTNAYMDVLEEQQQVAYSAKNTKILQKILQQTTLQFKAGIKKTADVDNARAAFDSSLSSLAHEKNKLVAAKANLQAITSIANHSFASVIDGFPLISPKPQNLSAWLGIITQKNLTIMADRFTALAAKQNIQQQQVGNYPTLAATAGVSGNYSKNNGMGSTTENSALIGVNLDFPIYQGGLVTAETTQAVFQYQLALSQELKDYRTAYNQIQQAYSSILTDITAIKLDRLAISSNQRSYDSTVIAYDAGTRNMMDLLSAQQALFSAQSSYLQDKYQYFKDFVSLKQAAGSLSVRDLQRINRWLK